MVSQRHPSKLIYANPETEADMLYFGKFSAPDPFIAFEIKGKKIAILSPLELGRGKKESGFDKIHSLEEIKNACIKRKGKTQPKLADIILCAARLHGVRSFTVPDNFPLGLALSLKKRGVSIQPSKTAFCPKREFKSDTEAQEISKGNRIASKAFREVERILKESKITGRRLYLKGKLLSSEYLQERISITCLEHGGLAATPIAACADQACDPHERGSGPIYANQLIIVDIFPRVRASGYHGDMTRTYLRGKASDAQKALVQSVAKAQKEALKLVKAGTPANKIHEKVQAVFAEDNFKTGSNDKGYFGFFHGTGHGIGLDIHEAPRVGTNKDKLKKNQVITVEPGLYYPGLGGCRIEDVVRVQKEGYEMLSKHAYRWEYQ